VPDSAVSPQSAVTRLGERSSEIRAAIYLDDDGEVAASEGLGENRTALAELAGELLAVADSAGARSAIPKVGGVEVSSPAGGVFALRGRASDHTLVAVAGGGALPGLVMYDLRMTLAEIEGQVR
jgi:hypothetical protein